MSGFAGPRSRPWVGMAGADTPSQPDADADAAAASSVKGGGADVAATNASAISFGFAATAVLVSLFLLMAIFEHLIKPGLASSSDTGRSDHDEEDGNGEGSGRGGLPPARRHPRDDASPDKLRHWPKVEEPVTAAADLQVLMPGQRYPTFLAQPAPLPPCAREGVWWPPHEQRHSFVPP